MKTNVLIIGAGAVAHVVAHKCAQNNDILGNICIASRRKEKCDRIAESIRHKRNLKDKSKKLYARQIDATDVPSLVKLIKVDQILHRDQFRDGLHQYVRARRLHSCRRRLH